MCVCILLPRRDIAPNDKFIIIASDGVFEFLTNQMVADMVARFPDPLDACKAVVAESYNMWLQYEVRTDDITIIAMYIDEARRNSIFEKSSSFFTPEHAASPTADLALSGGSSADNSENKAPAAVDMLDARPVRRVMSREKRKNMIQLKDNDVEDQISEADIAALVVEKNAEDALVISNAIKSNFLFQHLSAQQRTAVIGVMRQVDVKAGDWVIKQGDQGDRFYVVDSGRFEVRVRALPFPAEGEVKEGEHIGGSVVHVYESGVDQHPGFGELSLM